MYVVLGAMGILLSLACGGGGGGGGGAGAGKQQAPAPAPAPACIEGRTKCLHGDVMKCQGGDWRLDYDCSPNEPCEQGAPEDEAVCVG